MIYIGLLRAVNVGGTGMVAMSALREFLAEVGYPDARTLLQSGNVVFKASTRSPAALEQQLETAAADRLKLKTVFMLRSATDWSTVVAGNPFKDAAKTDPGHLLVMFLKDEPSAEQIRAARAAITANEELRVKGKHAYVTFPNGVGRSKFTNAVIERSLGTRATGRNWRTVLRIAELVESL